MDNNDSYSSTVAGGGVGLGQTPQPPAVQPPAATAAGLAPPLADDCLSTRYWWCFLLSSFITFLAWLAVILVGRLAQWMYRRRRYLPMHLSNRAQRDYLSTNSIGRGDKESADDSVSGPSDVGCLTAAKDWAGELISGQTTSGRILVVFVFFLSVASLIIYFIDAYTEGVESCTPWSESTTQQVDLAFNVFFMLYFCIRFVAAQHKLWFLLELYSWVDYFTITPSFVSIYLNRNWLGLRFLRALRLMNLPDILQYLNILHTNKEIRLANLVALFVSIWLSAAGLIHLVENSGDPWENFSNIHKLTYGESVYFILVTFATVGYGDIAAKTALGRLFMIFLIMTGLAIFASALPEIYELLNAGGKYSGSYKLEKGKKHVVVCGHITYDSVSNFLGDFLHKDREGVDVEIVFIDKIPPDLDLEGLFKRHFTQVKFILGSVMNANDLDRVSLKQADACLILANKYCEDPDAEDAANIMRAISVKNYRADIKIIIQLMQYHNKAYLLNVPSWNWKQGDDAVCLAELKLGFIAQSCLAPGFSTLLANLFTMRSYKAGQCPANQQWLNDYQRGAGMEMYTEDLSNSFVGMTFADAARLCFVKLRILLIAIECKNEEGNSVIAINPTDDSVRVEPGTQGFFIAQSDDEAKRAHHYCHVCHHDAADAKLIRKCRCHGPPTTNENHVRSWSKRRPRDSVNDGQPSRRLKSSPRRDPPVFTEAREEKKDRGSISLEPRFDSTGMFHWCPERRIDDCILNAAELGQIASPVLESHIIVCLFSEGNSPLIGLGSFVMPLRASNIHYEELKDIVLIGNLTYLTREWVSIKNFPKIFVLSGSPLNRANLRSANINTCEMCVILSARKTIAQHEDSALVDKAALLCSLNIKSMNFDDSAVSTLGVTTSSAVSIPSAPIAAALTKNPASRVPSGGGSSSLGSYYLPNSMKSKKADEQAVVSGSHIPMITELANDSNVQFLDQDDDDDPDTELYMTQPFACGTAFAVSVLDSLMSTSYFNENALTLIRSLVTGGATPELELIMAEGAGVQSGESTLARLKMRDRCKVGQLALADGDFGQFGIGSTYGELFLAALKKSVMCIGLHRLRDLCHLPISVPPKVSSPKRYVITNPAAEFPLLPTDMVFCFLPFDVDLKTQKKSMASLAGCVNNTKSLERVPSKFSHMGSIRTASLHRKE